MCCAASDVLTRSVAPAATRRATSRATARRTSASARAADLALHRPPAPRHGRGSGDGRPEGLADGREWRTAPLWGIGLTETVSGHTFFLHDGRARNLTEAILWHGGEAQRARDGFAALSPEDRERLLAFVNSL